MYQPAPFRVEDIAVLHGFIRAHPLGLLISADQSGQVADLLPVLADSQCGGKGVLRAHMARANPHWRLLQQTRRALVVFQASGHYISPGWYPTKLQTGEVVPTWNYVMVQVKGCVRVRDDASWVRQQVEDITRVHESGRAAAWRIDDTPDDFIAAQLRAIVGFEIEIEEMNGKFKLSQNRPAQDRAGVVASLEAEGVDGVMTAALMRSLGIGT